MTNPGLIQIWFHYILAWLYKNSRIVYQMKRIVSLSENVLKFDHKKSRICPIWSRAHPLWAKLKCLLSRADWVSREKSRDSWTTPPETKQLFTGQNAWFARLVGCGNPNQRKLNRWPLVSRNYWVFLLYEISKKTKVILIYYVPLLLRQGQSIKYTFLLLFFRLH